LRLERRGYFCANLAIGETVKSGFR
jgi:hypothetical protein